MDCRAIRNLARRRRIGRRLSWAPISTPCRRTSRTAPHRFGDILRRLLYRRKAGPLARRAFVFSRFLSRVGAGLF
jgi:hypothetical protein